jgi:hypothetical protein
MYFSPIKRGTVILQSAGVYRMGELFSREGEVYAKFGSGFVGLRKGGATTKGKLRWEACSLRENYDKMGRLLG